MHENSVFTLTKKTGKEWNEIFQIVIFDPDGWDRGRDDFETMKIDIFEFMERVNLSTVMLNVQNTQT